MQIKLQLDPGATAPTRAHDTDTGYDIRALSVDVAYRRCGKDNLIWKIRIDTGVHVQPPAGYYFELVPNSRLSNTPFSYANSIGIIDQGYTGSIKVILNCDYNTTNERLIPQPGDVVGQLILRKRLDADFIQVDTLTPTERGTNGFGSTANNKNS